jgi:hypothetical protein
MYYDGKKITLYSLSPESKGEREYVPHEIASYHCYSCSYCLDPFYLVDPDTHDAGGAFQRELLKKKDAGEVLAVKRYPSLKIANLMCVGSRLWL